MSSRDQFWVTNPQNLNLLEFWPCRTQTTSQKYNSVTVLSIYICIVIALGISSFTPLYLCILIVGVIAVVYYSMHGSENFMPIAYEMSDLPYRPPRPMNPFMNVPITDYDRPQDYKNYHRYKEPEHPTPHTEKIKEEVQDDFMLGLFQNPSGKLFDRTNSQREYISQPVGSVPNKQGEFANWLYGMNEGVCKSGSIYMRYGVDVPDQLLCNGINAAEPTNNGILYN